MSSRSWKLSDGSGSISSKRRYGQRTCDGLRTAHRHAGHNAEDVASSRAATATAAADGSCLVGLRVCLSRSCVPDDRVRATAGDQSPLGERFQHSRSVCTRQSRSLRNLVRCRAGLPGCAYCLKRLLLRDQAAATSRRLWGTSASGTDSTTEGESALAASTTEEETVAAVLAPKAAAGRGAVAGEGSSSAPTESAPTGSRSRPA